MILVVASSAGELQGAQQFPVEEGQVFRRLPDGRPLVAVSVGVGKVQAAIGTFEAIKMYKPERVFGIGSCCALKENIGLGTFIIPSHLLQYDIDLRRFGLPRGTVYGGNGQKVGSLSIDSSIVMHANPAETLAGQPVLHNATIGSADRFLTPEDRISHAFLVDELYVDAVDMESHAMVAAAQRAQTPVSIIRTVSDLWTGQRVSSLPQFLTESSHAIFALIAKCS